MALRKVNELCPTSGVIAWQVGLKRVAIGRALVHDPQLVLADEPTGDLDLETGREVLDLLDRITRAAGKTLIMVTHSREVVGLAK